MVGVIGEVAVIGENLVSRGVGEAQPLGTIAFFIGCFALAPVGPVQAVFLLPPAALTGGPERGRKREVSERLRMLVQGGSRSASSYGVL